MKENIRELKVGKGSKEDKETNKEVEQSKKLTYEELKAYAMQIESRAKQLFMENKMLKQMAEDRYFDYAFKCIENKEVFSKDFIKLMTSRIETSLKGEEEAEEENAN